MVRPMKCPYCGKEVSVSSHWSDTTCPHCRNVFEIGLEVFELSEEEQKKEQERALAEIRRKEKEDAERKAEAARRLRRTFRLPDPDPHKNIRFEEEEKTAQEPSVRKKKMAVILLLAGTVLLVVIAAAVLLSVAGKRREEPAPQEETLQEEGTEQGEQVVDTTDGQAHDSGWNDGWSIDSNPEDGMFKIDLQSSDTGEQKDVKLKPDVADDSGDAPEDAGVEEPLPDSGQQVQDSAGTQEGPSGDYLSVNGLHSSAAGTSDTGNAGQAGTPSGADENREIEDALLNGTN